MRKFHNVYLEDSFVIAGLIEGKGPIGSFIDLIYDYNDPSFNKKEAHSLNDCITNLLAKTGLSVNSFELALSGDLSNQLGISNYTYRSILIPYIGIYSACSTITALIITAGLIIDERDLKRVLISTVSNTQNSERQFRSPNEYGGEKSITQTTTTSTASAAIISNYDSKIKITEYTIGKVIDVGFKDVLDFGRAMAPAAIESLLTHFHDFKTKPSDYDLILTGDLSKYGYDIVKSELEKTYGEINNYSDCGLMIYDIDNQNVCAGGSGCGCSASVLLAYIKKKMQEGTYKKVLLAATGALINPSIFQEKESVPAISHIVVLEVNDN